MTQKPSAISEISLLDLVRNKKYKSFAQYIKQIENVNEQAQGSIINVLSNILVKKTQKDPSVMFSALMLYKMLMIGAVFDFTMDEEYFPMSIHDEVIKICEYKPQIETFSSRGADYFVELFKIAKTEQNKEIIERSGNTYVLLALELIQSLASWYPQDFFRPKTKSYFKKKYDEVLAKKVTFPKKDQLLIIKKVDQDTFKANYQRFIKRMEEIDDSPNKQQVKPEAKPLVTKPPPSKIQQPKEVTKSQISKDSKKMPPPPPPLPLPLNPATMNNTMNISSSNADPLQKSLDMLNLQGQVTSSVQVHHKNPIVRPKNDPSMIAIENILATNNLSESGKPNPTLSNVPKQKASTNIIPKKEDPKKQAVQRFESSIRSSDSEPPAVKATKIVKEQLKPVQIKKAAEASGIISNKVEEKKPKASQIKSLPARESIKAPSVIKPTQRQVIRQQQPQALRAQNLKKQQKAPAREIVAESIVTKIESNKIQKADSKTQENLKQSDQLQNPLFSFKQKEAKNERANNQKTPIKMAKMEKQNIASLQVSPQQIHQQNQTSNRSKGDVAQRADPQQTKRPRTMPKTQKRNTTAINFFNPNVEKNQFQFYNQSPNTSKQFNKTLSYWAMNRAKNQPSKQIDKSLSLNSILQEMRLDYKTLPFIPKYYQPITISMHALRQQSLTLFNSGISSNQFYSNHTIECRLLKQSHNVFTLIIQNVSNDPILIEYCEMKTIRFSNRIKILSWANKPDITGYTIPRKGYMDIKFKFEVADLNFKFLAFLLRINEKVQSLILPITLLDMCDIFTPINHDNLYRYSLKGSIISSQPFSLTQRGLPSFLGGFKFSSLGNSRNRKDPHQIIGECSLRLQNEDEEDPYNSVEIVLRIADWQEKLVEIDVIYVTKSQYCENLGKIIMYLLIFLMKND